MMPVAHCSGRLLKYVFSLAASGRNAVCRNMSASAILPRSRKSALLASPEGQLCHVPSRRSHHLPSLNQMSSSRAVPKCPALIINIQMRTYAKGQKQKDKKSKSKTSSVHLSAEEMTEVIDLNKMAEQMEAALVHLKQDYVQQLSLRTSQGLFDNLMIDTPDGRFPLIQLGQITQKGPQLMVINMSMTPQHLPHVKQAIFEAGMNLNPQQDGTSIFIPIPKVTKEHRENLAKGAKTLCEKTKVKLRDVQNKSLRDVKKVQKSFSEDLIRNIEASIHEKTSGYNQMADELMVAKQKELVGGK